MRWNFTPDEISVKILLGNSLMNVFGPFIASNGAPYLQMTSVGSLRTWGRERGGGRTEVSKEGNYGEIEVGKVILGNKSMG